MSSIIQLRQEIEKLHEELLHLILKRKNLVSQIWEIKKTNRRDMIDLDREKALIDQFDQTPELQNDPALKNFYHNVVKNIIAENKKYARKA
ncbi:MAG: chorismate mutase [Moraxellaceae bacterium]|nr:chorismate mutase [Pseudobdellovibrionaceae bacterium]